jgi:low temperature requirement protein LtrA
VVRVIHVLKFVALSSHDDAELRQGTLRLAPAFVAAPACIVAAAFVHTPVRELLWIAAAVIDYGAPAVLGLSGFRVSPSYFVSRHGSIIIIALGESIVELGAWRKGSPPIRGDCRSGSGCCDQRDILVDVLRLE